MTPALKVLVTGASGQLGRELQETVPGSFEIVACDRAALDVTDPNQVATALDRHVPDLVVNAAAYTAVDRAESEKDTAMRVNGMAPGLLARATARHGARLIHISTDFVFDGRSGSPYSPGDATNPLSVYGESKLAGEREILRHAGDGALILRTAWLYSRFGANFVYTMLRLMRRGGEISVVADQIGTPTWARSLAGAIWRAAERPAVRGIHHWTDAGVASWYDFAVAVQEEAHSLGLLAGESRIRPISWRDFAADARRPEYGVLETSTTWSALDLQPEHWRARLREMLSEIESNPEHD